MKLNSYAWNKLSATYRFDLPRYDQTLTPVGECDIEFVIVNGRSMKSADRGRWRRHAIQPERDIRLHLNQHREDMQTLKKTTLGILPSRMIAMFEVVS